MLEIYFIIMANIKNVHHFTINRRGKKLNRWVSVLQVNLAIAELECMTWFIYLYYYLICLRLPIISWLLFLNIPFDNKSVFVLSNDVLQMRIFIAIVGVFLQHINFVFVSINTLNLVWVKVHLIQSKNYLFPSCLVWRYLWYSVLVNISYRTLRKPPEKELAFNIWKLSIQEYWSYSEFLYLLCSPLLSDNH